MQYALNVDSLFEAIKLPFFNVETYLHTTKTSLCIRTLNRLPHFNSSIRENNEKKKRSSNLELLTRIGQKCIRTVNAKF